MSSDSLARVAGEVRGCQRCRLAATRTNAVPGEGAGDAPLMLVGEAPGAAEDATGRPFQGAAGRHLDAALAEISVDRSALFITSVNKCRPPGNRNPRPDEQAACRSYLERQLTLVSPVVVLAMGCVAARALHPGGGRSIGIDALRGMRGRLPQGGVVLATYHPAAAMRFPSRRAPFAEDLALACRLAGLMASE
ncbi:MAG TPA: uracil-DNA glycosylase [Longimicrobiaceae bacterium]|nr:uracil-DNA glycosylase [Longimicrobiaceae bacterium]